MSVFAATPVASASAPVNLTPATHVATAEQALGTNVIVTVSSDQALSITFGAAGAVATPSASVGHFIPANVPFTFDTGVYAPSFKLFNVSGSTANISIQPFSKF